MNRPIAYSGDEPYLFISYAHKDSERVLPVIWSLQEKGFRVWYDEGIEVGSHWGDVIASHLLACTSAVCFITADFLRSTNCLDEIHFAKEEGKGPLIVFLDPVEMPPAMRLQYGRLHALSYRQFPSDAAFLEKLAQNHLLTPCQGTAPAARPASTPKAAPPVTPASAGVTVDASNVSAADCFTKGINYCNGEGVPKDPALGNAWYRAAADKGHAGAMCNLG